MFVSRLSAVALLGAVPFVLANCSSDDDSGTSMTGGAATTAGAAGTTTGGATSGGGGAGGGGTTTGGSTTAGSGNAGSTTGGTATGGGGAATGGGGAATGGGGAATGGGGAASGGGGAGGASGGTGGGGGGTTGGTFKLSSAEITEGMKIPEAHTCDGGGGQMNWGVAPSFKWENPPAGTMSYAFFMIDWTLTMKATPDVNGYHSGAWNIPTTVTELPKGWGVSALGSSAKAINGGYLGPCPPSGTDTYHMIVLALPMASYTINGTGTSGVRSAYDMLKGVALATAELTGTYIRK